MSERFRTFYYFVLGAFGGATGWILNGMVFYGSLNLGNWKVLIVSGTLIGGAIGFSLALHEWLSTGSLIRLLTFASKGLLIGMLAGAVALPLTQMIYGGLVAKVSAGQVADETSIRRFLVGLFCWLVFGGVIGSIEGFYKGTQIWKGWLGGLLGALVGGTFYEIARTYYGSADNFVAQCLQAASLALMGGSIGAAIALVSTVMRKAWVKILSGKAAGREIDVTKYVDRTLGKRKHGIIGSDQYAANIYLPNDAEVLPKHAFLSYSDEVPTLAASPEAIKIKALTTVNNRPISKSPLTNNDKIRIGGTDMVYYQRRK